MFKILGFAVFVGFVSSFIPNETVAGMFADYPTVVAYHAKIAAFSQPIVDTFLGQIFK